MRTPELFIRPRFTLLLVALLLAGLLAACGDEPVEESTLDDPTATTAAVAEDAPEDPTATVATEPTEEPTPTEVPPTPTPEPTPTEVPPTPTPEPTATPVPPTPTPEPTATPVPPTPTPMPQPVSYSGFGDDVVSIEKPGDPDDPVIVYVRGNAESRHFAVQAYDALGESTGLLVNTTDVYEGTVPLDFRESDTTTRLEVTSNGEWYIEIRPLSTARVAEAPGTITGSGDEVFIVNGELDTAVVTGNAEGRYFGVITYGSRSNLAVNTTDPYEGRVIIPADTVIVEVTAVGEWTITFE